MTPEELELVDKLCKRIADEKDVIVFKQLVEQLDEVLERKEKRLTNNAPKPSDS